MPAEHAAQVIVIEPQSHKHVSATMLLRGGPAHTRPKVGRVNVASVDRIIYAIFDDLVRHRTFRVSIPAA